MASRPNFWQRFLHKNAPSRDEMLASRWLKPFGHRIAHSELWRFTRRSVPRAVFAGLFIVVAGFEKTGLEQNLKNYAAGMHLDNIFILSAVTAALSNIVSNVPAVLMLKPFLGHLADPGRGWLILAMASTFAGNLTLVGSVANLIVVEKARREVKIGFWEYTKIGFPLGVLTILIGALLV